MIDAFGNCQSILLIGGSSEIGVSIVKQLNANDSLRLVSLVGRTTKHLDLVESELVDEFTNLKVVKFVTDLSNLDDLEKLCLNVFDNVQYDVVILSAGILPQRNEESIDNLIRISNVNFTSQMVLGSEAIKHFHRLKRGTLVVVSSVAMERPRLDNYFYSATKSGLDNWANGLSDSLIGSQIRILVVRPGMVRTKMSQGINEAPFTCNPEDIAKAVADNLHKGSNLIWVPGPLKYLMMVLKLLPRKLFIRISRQRN
jgi:decaprenylphospho-beta-D-erythro-pentofuranosid-2-ulose 2-reductase